MSMFTFESAFPVAASAAAPVATGSTRKGGRRNGGKSASTAVKEYAAMTTAEKRLFNLEKARNARRSAAQTPSTPEEKSEKRAEYVRTTIKLVNLGHGRREIEINGVLVGVKWNGEKFAYFCGSKRGTAADRGTAVAKLNVLTSEAGLGVVRA